MAFDLGAGDREVEEAASRLRDTGFQNTNLIPLPTQLALVTGVKPTQPPPKGGQTLKFILKTMGAPIWKFIWRKVKDLCGV